MVAPIKAPDIRLKIEWLKWVANSPITTTLPQVNKNVEWNPIKKSVIKKLKIKAGIYLTPNKAGT